MALHAPNAKTPIAGLMLLSLALLACSIMAKVRARIDPPPGSTIDRAHLYLSVATGRSSMMPKPPTAGVDIRPHESEQDGASALVKLDVRCNACLIHMTAWHDVNRNGKPDKGDEVGSMSAPVAGKDPGWRGTFTEAGVIALKPLP